MTPSEKLKSLGITLPPAKAPVANYVPYVISGPLLFISGQVSMTSDGQSITGRLGDGLTVETGQKAARLCAINLIAQMHSACGGDLNRIKRVVKLGGFVNANAIDTGPDIPQIINGCSNLLVDVFGDAGRHARFAVGAASLPLNAAVEIDAICEIAD